jgi:hypothetical protein
MECSHIEPYLEDAVDRLVWKGLNLTLVPYDNKKLDALFLLFPFWNIKQTTLVGLRSRNGQRRA